MKISSINTYNTCFGYDKRLNKSLKTALSKHPDRVMAEAISSLNDYCNLVEDSLREEEKSPDKVRYQDLQDMLSTAKQMLAGFVTITFPKLNYTDREYTHYNLEFIKHGSKKDDWRVDVMDALSEWLSDSAQSPKGKDPKKQLYKPDFDEEGWDKNNDSKQDLISALTGTVSSKLSKQSLLEQFKPHEGSPKGFQDVAGMVQLKNKLQQKVINRFANPEQAKLDEIEYGKKLPHTILLYGPPGCGKTYITEALVGEINAPMYLSSITGVGSSYINETPKKIKAAIDEAIKIGNEQEKPCLMFWDEFDTIAFNRGPYTSDEDKKMVGMLLPEIDKIKRSNVILIAATNKYNIIDPAIRRRFEIKTLVDVPDFEARKAVLIKNLTPLSKGQKLLASTEDLDTIAKQLDGYSISSICIISDEAATNALERDRADIAVQDYEKAIKETSEEKPNRKDYQSETKKNENKIGFAKQKTLP